MKVMCLNCGLKQSSKVCDPHLFIFVLFFYDLCSNEKGLNGIQTHCISTGIKMML